jgi:MYXO-CTERM domain-containing protein
LNVTSGAAPTVTLPHAGNPTFSALAFRASPNIAPPPPEYSIVSFTPIYGPAPKGCTSGGQGYGILCNPSCSFTIPSTGAGHLLFVEAGDEYGNFIQSISGGGNWVIPGGPNSCQINASQHGLSMQGENAAASCAYALSSAAGTTTLQVAMSGTASIAFAVWEIATTDGSPFAFDTQGSTGDKAALFWPGQPLSLSGANDVIFQLGWDVGGSLGPSYYAQPTILRFYNYFSCNQVASVILLDSGPTPPTPMWINDNANYDTFVTGVAFKTVGGSSPPDAGHGAPDGGTPADAGTPPRDAGAPPSDAGLRADSGSGVGQSGDAGSPCCSSPADAGSEATGGFGCASAVTDGPTLLLLGLVVLAFSSRRRRRAAGSEAG